MKTDIAEESAGEHDLAAELTPHLEEGGTRTSGFVQGLMLVQGTIGILFAINQVFNFQFFGIPEVLNGFFTATGLPIEIETPVIDTSFFYIVLALFLSLVFLVYPAYSTKKQGIPFYDWILYAAAMFSGFYMANFGQTMIQQGWDILAPMPATIVAAVVCCLCLEAVRRAGGWILFAVCLFFFLYPLFAEEMPGFLWGPRSTAVEFVRQHALGTESIIGLPMRVVANLLIGFLVFGSALVVTGGGEFFMSFATAIMGKSRGGPAKVAILSSGFFGSLSGSVISNVVTTGQITIPTMKRIGYPAHYAGAVEACASTGGALMPPVMGAVAFIMAEFLAVPYTTVMIAAVTPAVLFYLALLLQADNYAARNGLKGQPADEIPRLWDVFKSGWYYVFTLAVLVYLLVFMRIEALAPYFATVILIITCLFRRTNRFDLRMLRELLIDSTRNIVNIVGILVGIGLIVGSLSYTGVGPAFSGELLQMAGDNVYLLLILGAITSFILGMGMTVSACYIFLAIVMGQAVIDAGLDPVAGHLFILYWGMMSYITPPVAVAAVAASTIAKSHPMRTGFMAMRLGMILFFLPFLFVLNPTLILHGEPFAIVHDVTTAILAVWLIASGTEGWLYWYGRISWFMRAPLILAGLAFLKPGYATDLVALVIIAAVYLVGFTVRRKGATAGA